MTSSLPHKSKKITEEIVKKIIYEKLSGVIEIEDEIKKLNRIRENIKEISLVFKDIYPQRILDSTIGDMINIIPYLKQKYKKYRSITHKRIYVYFLAILDTKLSFNHDKLSPLHFDLLKENNLIGESNVCSYLEMKKKKVELQKKGFLEKSEPLSFSSLLAKKTNEMLRNYEEFTNVQKIKLDQIRKNIDVLLNIGIKPHINLDEAATVMIIVFFREYFKGVKRLSEFRSYICNLYNLDPDRIKRRKYEFKKRLKDEKIYDKLVS